MRVISMEISGKVFACLMADVVLTAKLTSVGVILVGNASRLKITLTVTR